MLLKQLESGLDTKTDTEDRGMDIYENHKEPNILLGAIVFARTGCGDFLFIKDHNDKNLVDLNVYVLRHEERASEHF
jgi:hypothetical protein